MGTRSQLSSKKRAVWEIRSLWLCSGFELRSRKWFLLHLRKTIHFITLGPHQDINKEENLSFKRIRNASSAYKSFQRLSLEGFNQNISRNYLLKFLGTPRPIVQFVRRYDRRLRVVSLNMLVSHSDSGRQLNCKWIRRLILVWRDCHEKFCIARKYLPKMREKDRKFFLIRNWHFIYSFLLGTLISIGSLTNTELL